MLPFATSLLLLLSLFLVAHFSGGVSPDFRHSAVKQAGWLADCISICLPSKLTHAQDALFNFDTFDYNRYIIYITETAKRLHIQILLYAQLQFVGDARVFTLKWVFTFYDDL